MGIIVLAVAILPLLGVGGMQLLRAEVPGPIKDTKLTARIGDTAAILWTVYLGITIACILALKLAGMGWFDAVCHAFSALSLGGFSTRDASVGAFDSPAIEAVLIVFMVIAALNFATHYTVWRARSLRAYWRDAEAKGVLLVLLVSTLGCAFICGSSAPTADPLTALRHVSFNLVSIATDCGFVSVDYAQWPIFVPFWMLFLSCVTASSGSTGGGIKMIRTLILVRQSSRELSRMIHPTLAAPVTVGGVQIPNSVVFAILGFIFLYFMSIVVLTFLLIFGGLDFISAFTAVIACINNAGPGLGQVGPGHQLSEPHRLRDLGPELHHAARAARGLLPADPVHARSSGASKTSEMVHGLTEIALIRWVADYRQTGTPPLRQAVLQAPRLESRLPQPGHGLEGKHAPGAAAVGDHFSVGRKVLQPLLQSIERQVQGPGHVALGVLLRGAYVDHGHQAVAYPLQQLRRRDRLQGVAPPEIARHQVLHRTDVGLRQAAQRRHRVQHPIVPELIAHMLAVTPGLHQSGGLELLEVLGGIGDA
jgi:hypothetical protein